MSIFDANGIPPRALLSSDVCIVGGGIAGITLALELQSNGLSVALVESGAFKTSDASQSLNEIESIGNPLRENFYSRVRALGGTSLVWGGCCMRMQPIDLKKRSWVPESGWPIECAELDGYYNRAEQLLGLPSLSKHNKHDELPKIEANELDMFSTVDLTPRTMLWVVHAKRYGRDYKKTLNETRSAVTYVNATVTDIVLHESGGGVDRVCVTSTAGNTFQIKAAHTVLASGGLENARLLLASTKQQHNGVGNQHDNVGRYYMDHPRSIAGQVCLAKPLPLRYLLRASIDRGSIQLGIGLREKTQQSERTLYSYLCLAPHVSSLSLSKIDRKVKRYDRLQIRVAQARKLTERLNQKLYSETLRQTYFRSYVLS